MVTMDIISCYPGFLLSLVIFAIQVEEGKGIFMFMHSDKKILIQNIIALPSHINAKAVSLMG